MGATNPKEADAGTIRADFAESLDENAVHGSDSLENAAIEIAYFFGDNGVCLTTDIRNYTEVSSDVLTTAVINRFIEDAEFRIYQELPMDSQRFVQEGTLSTDNNTINAPDGASLYKRC